MADHKGFLYLVAIMDWYSSKVLQFGLELANDARALISQLFTFGTAPVALVSNSPEGRVCRTLSYAICRLTKPSNAL
tara:strand:- start:45123 stop:45353 length:231 start_codon:yes stop_codon:yes gene_type:complete